jgi:hypothetical protein
MRVPNDNRLRHGAAWVAGSSPAMTEKRDV